MSVERKLAAIMFTDIAGYTATMSKDEAVAISLLNKKDSVLKPLIKEHNGTYVKNTGDGSLSYFNSAVDATMCAKRLQESIYDDKDLNVRVGVHLGDTIFEAGDIRGEGVNIAARLESMAVEGGVFISKEVQDQLINQKEFNGISLGLQSLKGVGRLIEVYGLKGEKLNEPNPDEYKENKIDKHTDDEVPSIAIIPFENKGKEEDDFYAYGISVDLISDCSSTELIRVASKKQIDDAGELPQDELATLLNVRYMANGELWRMGDIFQLSVELYDTKDKKVVWSDRWQEKWDNLPVIKMNLSDGLLKALDTTSKVERKVETTNAEAYEFYLKAKHVYEKRKNIDDTKMTRELLNEAIELDDNLMLAKILLGSTYSDMGDYDRSMKIFSRALIQAKELGDKYGIGISLSNIGNYYNLQGDYDKALEYYESSHAIRDEIGDRRGMGAALSNAGSVYDNKGDYNKALDSFERSLKIYEGLSDRSGMEAILNNIGLVYRGKGEFNKAYDFFIMSLETSEKHANKVGMGAALNNIGLIFCQKGDSNKALEHYGRSLKISEQLGDKYGVATSRQAIGNTYSSIGDYKKALDYQIHTFEIYEELAHKQGMGTCLGNIGAIYFNMGDYNKASDFYARSLKIRNEIGDKPGMIDLFFNIGNLHCYKGDYLKGLDYLKKSHNIQKEIRVEGLELEIALSIYIAFKHLGRDYNEEDIHSLIKDAENIEFEINFRLYELLEDTLYLETANKQVQEKASTMEERLSAKFLSFPIPKAIIEEYNKVFKK